MKNQISAQRLSMERNPTIRTYDNVAQQYFERNKDRSPVEHQLARFRELLKEQGVEHLPALDIGCGPGFDASSLRARGLNCIGVDLSMSMLEAGKQHFEGDYILSDMRRLPIAKKIGGLWVCASLLHLTREEAPQAIAEFARVLAPKGLLCLSVKEGSGERWTDAPYGGDARRFFTLFNPEELDDMIVSAGFQILYSSAESWTGETVWLTRFAVRD